MNTKRKDGIRSAAWTGFWTAISRWMLSTGGIVLLLTIAATPASGVEGLVTPKPVQRTITVGGPGADIPAFTSEAVQIAVDALATGHGGTVKLGAGTFAVSAPVRLRDGISLVGSGAATVLRKIDGFRTQFVIDADYGMLKVVVRDRSGFRAGMGVQLSDADHADCWGSTTARITAVSGDTLYIDTHLVFDYLGGPKGVISNACPVVEAIEAENVRIADLVVDGNGASNDPMTGCRGGGVYLHKVRNARVENVRVHHFQGDNFSWQITENITVRGCESDHAFGLGFHPGTGSDATRIEGCSSHDNRDDGIFLCWRVQNGEFRNNTIFANGRYGISIGHKDTDNLFLENRIYGNASHGVCFREENEENAGHRNTLRGNRIEDNGKPGSPAYGVYFEAPAADVILERNIIRSTGKGNQAAAVFLGPASKPVKMIANTVEGHPELTRGQR